MGVAASNVAADTTNDVAAKHNKANNDAGNGRSDLSASPQRKKQLNAKATVREPFTSIRSTMISATGSYDNLRRCLKSKGLVVADSDIHDVLAKETNMVDALAVLIDSGKTRKMVEAQRKCPDTAIGMHPSNSFSPPAAVPAKKRGRPEQSCGDDTRTSKFALSPRLPASTEVPTATLTDDVPRRASPERPKKRLNTAGRVFSDKDQPLSGATSSEAIHVASTPTGPYVDMNTTTSEVSREDTKPTEADVPMNMQLESSSHLLSTTSKPPLKDNSSLNPKEKSPGLRQFPKIPNQLDLSQMEDKMVTGILNWDKKSPEEKDHVVRGLKDYLHLPELGAKRKEVVERELSDLIMTALDDLASVGSSNHGSQLLGNIVRKVRVTIHETSQTIGRRYTELYTKNGNVNKSEGCASASDISDSCCDSRSGDSNFTTRTAIAQRGKISSSASGDESTGFLACRDEPLSFLRADRTKIPARTSEARVGTSAPVGSGVGVQTPTVSRKWMEFSAEHDCIMSLGPSTRNARASVAAAATGLGATAWNCVESSTLRSLRAMGAGKTTSSTAPAERSPPLILEEKYFWDSLKICREVLKGVRHNRKESEWLASHIGNVKQMGVELAGECGAEVRKCQEELVDLESERRRADDRMEFLTKKVIETYLEPGASKEDALRALLTNIQQGSGGEGHESLCRRQEAIQAHTSITRRFDAKNFDLLLLQRANDICMLLIRELYGDIIDTFLGLESRARQERTVHQAGLEATVKEALSRMASAVKFHMRRKTKAEAKISQGLRELQDDMDVFGDDCEKETRISQERLQKLRMFSDDSASKIAKMQDAAQSFRASLQGDLSAEALGHLSVGAMEIFEGCEVADIAEVDVRGSSRGESDYAAESIRDSAVKSESCRIM